MGVWDLFQLYRLVVKPFLIELQHGWWLRDGGWYDAKSVVHIPFQKNLLAVVGVPKVVGSLPL